MSAPPPDELQSALLKSSDLRVVLLTATHTARTAQALHGAAPAAASVLAQGLLAALILGSQQKETGRINLQLECDGPLRGMFLDTDCEGSVRGYVKNPAVNVQVGSEAYRFRPILGNKGFLSVLRSLRNGEHFRSAVELSDLDLSHELERFFDSSEQVPSLVRLAVLPKDGEALGQVVGLLVQPLPGGDLEAFNRLRQELVEEGAFQRTLEAHPGANAHQLLEKLFSSSEWEVMARHPVQFRCRCSRERVLGALALVGKDELQDMLEKEGKAEVTCDFCSTHYEVSGEEIRSLLS